VEVRIITEPEPHISPRSQGHHCCRALLGNGIGMEDPSSPMEQRGVSVQISKDRKLKEIQF